MKLRKAFTREPIPQKIAVGDWLTALVGLASLGALFAAKKLSTPVLVAATAVIGLIGFPILQPDWVYVK